MRVTVTNRGPSAPPRRPAAHLVSEHVELGRPREQRGGPKRPSEPRSSGDARGHGRAGPYRVVELDAGAPRAALVLRRGARAELLFTDNETNAKALWGDARTRPAVHEGRVPRRTSSTAARGAVNPAQVGTKAAARYALSLGAGRERVLRLRLDGQADAPSRSPTSTRSSSARIERGGRLLRRGRSRASSARRRAARLPPGDRGAPLDEAVLRLRRATAGSAATRRCPPPPAVAQARGGTASGRTSTTARSSRCPTSGSTPGTRRGTSRSTASRWRSSTPTSPSSSSRSSCASGTCTRTASSRRTSGRSAT